MYKQPTCIKYFSAGNAAACSLTICWDALLISWSGKWFIGHTWGTNGDQCLVIRIMQLLTAESTAPYSREWSSLQQRLKLLTAESEAPYSRECKSLQQRVQLLTAESATPYSRECSSLQPRMQLLTAESEAPYSRECNSLQQRGLNGKLL